MRKPMKLDIKKGAFHKALGKSMGSPITAKDISKGKKAGGHEKKMAIFAENAKRWHHKGEHHMKKKHHTMKNHPAHKGKHHEGIYPHHMHPNHMKGHLVTGHETVGHAPMLHEPHAGPEKPVMISKTKGKEMSASKRQPNSEYAPKG